MWTKESANHQGILFEFDCRRFVESNLLPILWIWRRGTCRRSPSGSSPRSRCPDCRDCKRRKCDRRPIYQTSKFFILICVIYITNWLLTHYNEGDFYLECWDYDLIIFFNQKTMSTISKALNINLFWISEYLNSSQSKLSKHYGKEIFEQEQLFRNFDLRCILLLISYFNVDQFFSFIIIIF
jgi:hypothetical protein